MTPAIMATTNCRLRLLRRIRTSSGSSMSMGAAPPGSSAAGAIAVGGEVLVLPMLSAPRPNSAPRNCASGRSELWEGGTGAGVRFRALSM